MTLPISIFTPCHSTKWIHLPYQSLKKQDYTDFEWVILLNGEISKDNLPSDILSDPRVRTYQTNIKGIGALKNTACKLCSGELLVELDHDDILTPNALSELYSAWKGHPHAFYYSDFVHFLPDDRSEVFSDAFGWRNYPFNFEGKSYRAMSSFDPTARSLAQIYFAPNHVRAWSRRAYYEVGGHDITLPVADDHDLLCRTYLAGVPFVHIPKVLYLYNRRDDNSYLQSFNQVQELQFNNMNRYMYDLIREECIRFNKPTYDIHINKPSVGYNSILFDDLKKNKYKFDLGDNSAGVIRMYNVLQYVKPKHIPKLIADAYRVLMPGGWLLVQVPSTDGRAAFQSPMTKSYWNEASFCYYTKREYFKQLNISKPCAFQAVRLWTAAPGEFFEKNKLMYTHADLCALKGQRQPGEVNI